MKHKVIFWTQALDNRSADLVELNGKMLGPDSAAIRSELVGFVSRRMSRGIVRSDTPELRVVSSSLYFVAQTRCAEKDSLGRSSAVVCCALKNAYADGDALRKELLRFSSSAGRTIGTQTLHQLGSLFDSVKKNTRQRKRIALLACAFVLLASIAWLIRSDAWASLV